MITGALRQYAQPGKPSGGGPRYFRHGQAVAGSPVDADDLLGHDGQIRASNAGRVAEWAEHHAGTGDERSLASGGHGPGDVPGVRGNQAQLADSIAGARLVISRTPVTFTPPTPHKRLPTRSCASSLAFPAQPAAPAPARARQLARGTRKRTTDPLAWARDSCPRRPDLRTRTCGNRRTGRPQIEACENCAMSSTRNLGASRWPGCFTRTV